MNCVLPLLIMALSGALAAPFYDAKSTTFSDPEFTLGYNRGDTSENIFIPQKRAALVLDRLLIALQKALHEESVNQRLNSDREGPRTAPLRLANFDTNDMTGLQRRGQGTARGRVLRCYFNAITCF